MEIKFLPVGKYMNYIYPCTPFYIKHYAISIMQHYSDQYSVSLEDIVLTGVTCHCIYTTKMIYLSNGIYT